MADTQTPRKVREKKSIRILRRVDGDLREATPSNYPSTAIALKVLRTIADGKTEFLIVTVHYEGAPTLVQRDPVVKL